MNLQRVSNPLSTNDGLETEIKLSATPAMLEALRDHPLLLGPGHTGPLVTTYFDTPGRRLLSAGVSLRLRENGKGREQTVKLPAQTGSIVVRGEWTVPAHGPCPDIGAFGVGHCAAIERLLAGDALAPLAETRIERTVRQITHDAATFELAFDRGTIRADDREEAVSELEIELVAGSLVDVLDLAHRLPLGPDLQWSVASKSGRCLALADGTAPAAVHAAPTGITRTMDTHQAFRAIAWSGLSHLLENAPLVVALGDSEAIHQSRVAIRRLRTAIGLFGPLFHDDDRIVTLDAELKAAATAMGPARAAHVLIERLTAAAGASKHGAPDLLAHLGQVAAHATAGAQAVLAGPGFQTLLFELALWVERGAWLDRVSAVPLPHFAAHALRKCRRKVCRLKDDPAGMTSDARHALRIAAKKWRYAADFFAPLYPSKGARKAQRRFKALAGRVQAQLGDVHDIDELTETRDSWFAGLDPIVAARLGAELDALLPGLAARHHKLLKQAGRAVTKLEHAEPWWMADL